MKLLITAGPTREALDPVRFISNRSSGRMGYALASVAAKKKYDVVLISGPVALPVPDHVRCVRVVTAEELLAAVRAHLAWCDVLVMAAAVADWRPKKIARQKIKKQNGPPKIEWEPTPDILKTIAPLKKKQQVFCGFAAETHNISREAKRKMRAKNLDMIVANDVSKSDRGFENERNAVTIYTESGGVVEVPLTTKTQCARRILTVAGKISVRKKSENF